uniref:Uncharacterized protein n=1 Tax=Rhinolophus ferrumequinum TaxID=59479 RepID=A0A671DRG2_RHIFE
IFHRGYCGQGQNVQKVMVQPVNLTFRYLQNRSQIQVWLYEQVNVWIEGCIVSFVGSIILRHLFILFGLSLLLPDDNKCCRVVFI